MTRPEQSLQTRGVEYIRYALPNVMVIAVPNEQAIIRPRFSERIYALIAKAGLLDELDESISTQRMIRIQAMKRMGMYPGCADLLLFWQDGQFAALETKADTRQSVNQEKFQEAFEQLGGRYKIWHNLTELHDALVSFGLNPITTPPDYLPHNKKNMQAAMYHQMMLDISKNNG